MNVKELMSSPAVTCRPDHTLDTAARLMWEHDCGAIPVVNRENVLVGMVTDRDICMAAYTQAMPLHDIEVATAMAKQVFFANPTDTLDTAEQLMRDVRVRRLPVVDNKGRPIGLLSLNDIARHAASARKKGGLEHEVTRTLAAICQPWPTRFLDRKPEAGQAIM